MLPITEVIAELNVIFFNSSITFGNGINVAKIGQEIAAELLICVWSINPNPENPYPVSLNDIIAAINSMYRMVAKNHCFLRFFFFWGIWFHLQSQFWDVKFDIENKTQGFYLFFQYFFIFSISFIRPNSTRIKNVMLIVRTLIFIHSWQNYSIDKYNLATFFMQVSLKETQNILHIHKCILYYNNKYT